MLEKTTEKKKVAIYCRVSTDEQVQNWNWLEIQKEALLNYVKAHEYQYTLNSKNIYIDEWKSWASKDEKDRPALHKMFEDAQLKEFDILLVWKIDRFFRKTLYLLEWVELLDELWVWFLSITQPFDTTHAFWKMFMQMMWAVAELERDLIRERTHSGIIASMKKGKWCRWLHPFWYDKDENNFLVINKEEAEIVKKIFRLLVEEKFTLNAIQNKLNDLWYETPTSKWKTWEKKLWKIKHKNYWHNRSIQRIINNETYIWRLIQNRFKKWKIEKPEEEWIISECPQIIDRNTFEQAQSQLQRNTKYSRRNKKEWVVYMLSTLLYDKETGYKYSWYLSSKWTKNYRIDINNKSKKKVAYRWISWKKIESVVWRKIKNVLEEPKLILNELQVMYEKNNDRDIKWEIEDLKMEILVIKNNSKNLLKLTNGLDNDSIEDIKEALDDNSQRVKKIKLEIVKLESQELTEEQKQKQLEDLTALSLKMMNKLDDLSYEEKTEICRNLIDKIEIEDEKLEITLLVPINWNDTNKSKAAITSGFFNNKNSFIKDNLKTPLTTYGSKKELDVINGRRCGTRTRNPTVPNRVRYQLR